MTPATPVLHCLASSSRVSPYAGKLGTGDEATVLSCQLAIVRWLKGKKNLESVTRRTKVASMFHWVAIGSEKIIGSNHNSLVVTNY